MEDDTLFLDEASARQLVLARAVEDVDTQGKLLSAVEREQIEREALAASRGNGASGIDFAHYLQQRARRMLAVVDNRQPRIAALQDPEDWRRWLLLALPVLACALGAAIDRIDNPHQVNMLSPPLLGHPSLSLDDWMPSHLVCFGWIQQFIRQFLPRHSPSVKHDRLPHALKPIAKPLWEFECDRYGSNDSLMYGVIQ